MSYQYHYTGDLDVHLPTFGINAKGNDKEAVYETTEQINHPDFVLVSEQPAEPGQTQEAVVEETPQVEPEPQEEPQENTQGEAQQTENVSEGEAAQVE